MKPFLTTALVISMISMPVHAEGLALKKIMNTLANDMSQITHSIALEDWSKVEEAAQKIANHDKPPMLEKIKILKLLGSEASDFKAFDDYVHDMSLELAKHAKSKDSEKVINTYTKVLKGCVDCHQRFKNKVQDHFYTNE